MLALSPTTRRRGFTLVELLVVVAVIALLIGVLLPALAGARESSRRVMSAANLRQIAVYNNLYAEDYQDWYPMVYAPLLNSSTAKTRHPSPEDAAQVQGAYGGFAGFFSYNQKNGDTNTNIYRQDTPYYWNGTAWIRSSTKGKYRPIMDKYMEGPQSYAVLQNPADTSDGGENGPKLPLKTPEKILDEYNVTWYNISYMYIAGLKRTDASLCFLGDESNHCDWGNPLSFPGGSIPNHRGTMRRNAPDVKDRGLADVDNHGKAGGNYAYTDGHVEWIRGASNDNYTTEYGAAGVDPHDRLFTEINMFLARRGDSTQAVMTVD